MAGDTAIFLCLTHGSAPAIGILARDRLALVPEPWEARWLVKQLGSKHAGMPGSRGGISVAGFVSKYPEPGSVIKALEPILLDVFQAHPDGRLLVYTESFDSGGDGAIVHEAFATEPELRAAGAKASLEFHRYFIPASMKSEEPKAKGAEAFPTPSRARDVTTVCVVCVTVLAERARHHAAALTASSPAASLARELLEDFAARESTDEYDGPKGSLELWSRTGQAFDAAEFVSLLLPYWQEATDEFDGAVMFFQNELEPACACRVGQLDEEFVIRYHDVPFGMHWIPAFLRR